MCGSPFKNVMYFFLNVLKPDPLHTIHQLTAGKREKKVIIWLIIKKKRCSFKKKPSKS